VAGLAGLSLPGLSTFVSEFLVLVGTFTRYRAAAVAATVGIILAAIYILWLYQRTMTGPVQPAVEKFSDLKARELWAVGPLIALIVVFGFFPQPLLNIINPAVRHTLVQVHATDPVPPHPASASARGSTASFGGHPRTPDGPEPPGAGQALGGKPPWPVARTARATDLPHRAPAVYLLREKGTTP